MADKTDNYEAALEGASQDVAKFDFQDKSLLMRFQSALHKTPSLVPLIVLVCAIMIFTGWLGPRFLPQMTLVFQQIQVVGILALAQTLVILTAGIDLSVGAIAVFCSVIMGKSGSRVGWSPASKSRRSLRRLACGRSFSRPTTSTRAMKRSAPAVFGKMPQCFNGWALNPTSNS